MYKAFNLVTFLLPMNTIAIRLTIVKYLIALQYDEGGSIDWRVCMYYEVPHRTIEKYEWVCAGRRPIANPREQFY